MISCSIFDYEFDHALCDLGASVNIMPKVTFEKLGYPSISPTTMCVQLVDSTIRYPEGVVERLMVKVKNTYILVDFVVLDMEGDLEIPLILGRPFLKDTNARIDVGRGRISLRTMGKTMKFKFQNKREVFLIHEDSEKQGLWAEPGWVIKIIIPLPSQLGRIEKFRLHQPSQWKMIRRSLTSSPIQYGKIWKSSIQHPRILFLRRLHHQRRSRRCGARRT